MKKIYLQITPFFPDQNIFRGPYLLDQVKSIIRNSDYDVIVIKTYISFHKRKSKSYTYDGIKVYNFNVFDFPSSILPGIFNEINLYRLFKFLKSININTSEIEIIHAHTIYSPGMLAMTFGQKYGIKNFIQHHGLDIFQKENGRILHGKFRIWNNKFKYNSFIKIVNSTNLNVGVSQKVIDTLQGIKGYNNANNYLLYNGVDTNKFFKKENIKRSTEFTIGCIGNFWLLKDQITLLKAVNFIIKEGKDLKVKFVGSGPTLESCKEYVVNHNLENYVDFLSEIDHTKLNDFYNTLDLFVLPSYYEALGCVYTEALQVGVPIIAVKGQGIEELIKKEERDTSLISPHDHIKLAELIKLNMSEPKSVNYDLGIDQFIQPFLQEIKKI